MIEPELDPSYHLATPKKGSLHQPSELDTIRERIKYLERRVEGMGKITAFLFSAAAHDKEAMKRTGDELLAAMRGED